MPSQNTVTTSSQPALDRVPLDACGKYAEFGIPTLPVALPSKAPLTKHGFKGASLDPEQHARWRKDFPGAGIAIPTGIPIAAEHVLNILDSDPRHGGSLDGLELPSRTIIVRTPGGGDHVWLASPAGLHIGCDNSGRLGRGLDLKGAGGYVVVPPTPGYRFLKGRSLWNCTLGRAPRWFLEKAVTPRASERAPLKGAEWAALVESSLCEGNRDAGLARIAGAYFRDLPPRLAEISLHAMNRSFCRPPLSDAQVTKIANSIARREIR